MLDWSDTCISAIVYGWNEVAHFDAVVAWTALGGSGKLDGLLTAVRTRSIENWTADVERIAVEWCSV